jgi:hypothetical protein
VDKTIEMSFESPDGIIDCRLEPERFEEVLSDSATILYPNMVNGFSRSEIYCYTMQWDGATGSYCFEAGENDIHPKIKKLEVPISGEITRQMQEG